MNADLSTAWARKDLAEWSAMLTGYTAQRPAEALLDCAANAERAAAGLADGSVDATTAHATITNAATTARARLDELRDELPFEHLHAPDIIDSARALLAEINGIETRIRAAYPENQDLIFA